jgi:hypothetical protein
MIGALIGLIVVGGFITLFVVSLLRQRHGESDVAEPSWTSTNEVFKDPTTGRFMRVWLDAQGDRHYVPEK